jgi:epoxyqueuosine reductase
MAILSDNFDCRSFLEGEMAAHGFAAAASMALTPARLDELRGRLSVIHFQPELPEYLKGSEEMRRDPAKAFPWARSILMAAAPFKMLPELPLPLPRAKSPDTAGMVAGYAARTDYHLHGKRLMEKLLKNLEQATAQTFKFDICIDTKPLMERALAEAAGLGRIGRNSCILCPGSGSGSFIVSAMLDLDLPDVPAKCPETPCHICRRCVEQCPNQVIGVAPSEFKIKYCISSLTMEKRGLLTEKEMCLLGNNIFGCSACTSACPDSNLPEDFPLDLEWLLLASSAEVRRALTGAPMEYVGVTLLRRNALIALGNKGSEISYNLIKKFLKKTNSPFLMPAWRCQDSSEKRLLKG